MRLARVARLRVGARAGGRTLARVVSRARAVARASSADAGENTAMDSFLEALLAHQKTVARPTLASEARTLVTNGSTAMMATIGNASAGGLKGFPCGSVVAYAANARGRPTFALSSMSQHARDVDEDGRVTVTICANGFESVADARVSLSGIVRRVAESQTAETREAYLRKHPGAYWVDFGDFAWYEMTEIVACRIVGGFARAASVSATEYDAATCDPVNAFSAPVCSHMNADHADSLKAMVRHAVGVDVDTVEMRSIDRLGMNCRATKFGEKYDIRLAFESPAEDRKGVKEQIVLMTKNAASATA